MRDEAERPPMPEEETRLLPEMKRYLLSRKLSYKVAKDSGWYATSKVDGYDRIVIPCTNSAGIPYYQARAIDDWTHVRYNSPPARRNDSVVLVWPKLNTLIRGTVIVEGPMDSLAAATLGYLGVGLMGNQPPEGAVEYIVSLIKGAYEPVIILPDLDHPEMGSWMLASLAIHGITTRVRLPPRKDLAALQIWEREKLLSS